MRLLAGAVASGLLLALPFLQDRAWPAAWVGLVPLLLVLRGQPAPRAFLMGWAAGAIFFAATLYWLLTFGPAAWFAASAFLALYVGAFTAGLVILTQHTPAEGALLAAPILWVALEIARSSGMLAFPWALLGASQVPNEPILQLASVGGPYAISFLVVLANATLAASIVRRRRAWPAIAALFVAVAAAVGYGRAVLQPTPDGMLRVALVQPNVPPEDKLNPLAAERILRRLELLIAEAPSSRPDLLILPETAVPGDVFSRPDLAAWLRRHARAAGAVVVAGTFTTQSTNSAVAVSPNGEVLGRYDKVRLVAFGEQAVRPGSGPTPLRTPVGTLGVAISYESAFPQVTRALARGGADLLVIIANDGWFGRTAEPFQHAALARLRAVETRRFVVTAAETGISNIIDPYGRVMATTEIFREAVLFGNVGLQRGVTLFARIGTAMEPLLVGAGAALFVGPLAAFIRRERQNRLFREAAVSLSPLGAWALAQLLASTVPPPFRSSLVAALLAVGVWWASARIAPVPARLQRRGFILALAASTTGVATLAWLLAAAYAGKGLPLAFESARGMAALGMSALPLAAAEEVWVRALVFGALARWRGTGAALLISTVLSASLHAGDSPEALGLAVLTGAMFGAVRAWTGSAAGNIAAHAGWEGFLRGAGFL
ncbi:MAG: apolipoprotein N-acyltransferase [bacterium]